VVDDYYQTSVANIYAIGDVIDRMQLTPVAIAEGMCIANNLFTDNPPKKISYENIATAVFCQPNIGTVGPTEEEAAELYPDLQVFESAFKPLKHTMTGRGERSMMKLLVNGADDKVVAAHMVGPDAGEIIQGLAIAIGAGVTKSQFDLTIGIHPTAAEEFVTMRSPRA
jgi:glutathione reductase (NADPH)